ncbi:MAG TPA: FUSC family protein [Solirubrobacteraceae bacterium]|nr:FUSC family protein [Solirubrobacteraceae bacterium]
MTRPAATGTGLPAAVRASVTRRLDRLRGAWAPIGQTAVAAAVAWFVARVAFGHAAPYFAPASAVISLGVARGQPRRRAVELVAGVAVGIGIADILSRLIGTGAIQLGVVVALAMAAAVLLGGGTILVNQAAVSAILVLTLPRAAGQGALPERFVDALIGGAVALTIGQVLFPRNPLTLVAKSSRPILEAVVRAFGEVADALARGDTELAEGALTRLRSLDRQITEFYDALAVARETAWLSPPHRRARGQLRAYADASGAVDLLVRNARAVARAGLTAVRRRGEPDPELIEAIRVLAQAARSLGDHLADPALALSTRRLAADAAHRATDVLRRRHDLASSVLVGQIRATAFDLLRGSGLDAEAAREAIGPPVEEAVSRERGSEGGRGRP